MVCEVEFMRISVFLGHDSVAVLQTIKMLVIMHKGKKHNRGCLKSGNTSKPLCGITDNFWCLEKLFKVPLIFKNFEQVY